MGHLFVQDLDGRIINALKRRAQRNGRSVEAEHRAILESVLELETESFTELTARLRAESPPSKLNSTDLIREGRDRDYSYFPDP
ncbi:MAG TPA: hypothetical protein VJ779_04300 [Acetobacteraceae bacterium]|nr:hypothetical protein [Acetobacteraceae bacterium]